MNFADNTSAVPKDHDNHESPKAHEYIMQIRPYVAGKSTAEGAGSIIKLSSNENPMGPSPAAVEALKNQLEYTLHRYPEGSCLALRRAIGETYNIDPQRIVCGAGSDELIGLLIKAYAAPGDEILYPEHGFLMYKIYAQSTGAIPITAPEHELTTDVDALLERVNNRTKIVFIANPNNPTGSYITGDKLRYLREKLPTDILLVVDGAYAEYVSRDGYCNGHQLVEQSGNTVMLRTFSKIYGLSALRLGWAYASDDIIDVLNRVRSPFNVSTAAQIAGTAAIKDHTFVENSRRHNDDWLQKMSVALREMGLHPYPSVGNFILVGFPQGSKNSDHANAFLMQQGVIVREVAAYGLPHCLRITIGTEEENLRLIETLRAFMAS